MYGVCTCVRVRKKKVVDQIPNAQEIPTVSKKNTKENHEDEYRTVELDHLCLENQQGV
jgi:hypothetical protein